jgi:hypothetical protein
MQPVLVMEGKIAYIRRAMSQYRRPSDLASRLAHDRSRRRRGSSDSYRRETFSLPREAAREKARELFRRYPKAAYMTAIESWRELPGGDIEFTMRRLPSAD